MTDYDGLGGLIDEVIDAAIDATMRRTHWYPSGDGGYIFVRGEYDTVTVPGPHGGPTGEVTIGTESVNGSYETVPVKVNPTEEVYGPWRERITSAFEGWTDLPDPGAYDGSIARTQAGSERLSAGGDAGTGLASTGGNSPLAGDILSIITKLALFEGRTVEAFSDNYANRLPSVLSNQSLLGAGLTVSLTAEQKLWTEARASIVRIAQKAKEAFEASATGDGGGDAALTVLGVLAAAAGLFFTGGTGAAVAGGAGAVIGILKDVKSLTGGDSNATVSGGTPDSVYESLTDAIAKLDKDISTEEGRIDTMTDDILEAARDNDGNFNLARPDRLYHDNDPTHFVTAGNEIALSAHTLSKIGLEDMPAVAHQLRAAAHEVEVSATASMWSRPGGIGLSSTGPSYSVAAVSDHLIDILLDTSTELVDAGERLDIAARAFTQRDEQVSAALAKQSHRLDREQEERAQDELQETLGDLGSLLPHGLPHVF